MEVKAAKSAYSHQRGELLPAEVSAMADKALNDHLAAVYSDLTEAAAHAWKRGQTLLYLQSLAGVPRLATILINSIFLGELLRSAAAIFEPIGQGGISYLNGDTLNVARAYGRAIPTVYDVRFR